jgi:hypothetical protein
MPCDRTSAIRRLVNAYIERVAEDADYHRQVKIVDVLTEDAIAEVQSLDLYREMDAPSAHAKSNDGDLQLLVAWLSSVPMGKLQ